MSKKFTQTFLILVFTSLISACVGSDDSEQELDQQQEKSLEENKQIAIAENEYEILTETHLTGQITAIHPDNKPLQFTVNEAPKNGELSLDSSGQFVYIHASGFTGSDNFTVKVSDGQLSSVARFNVIIKPTKENSNPTYNSPPSISSTSFSTTENILLEAQLVASDPENDKLEFSLVSTAVNGSVTVNADGSFSYQPSSGFSGGDRFTVQVSDGELDTKAEVLIQVEYVNKAPSFNDASFSTKENTLLEAQLVASDPENDKLEFSLVSSAAHGSVTVNADGSFSYQPSSGFSGNDRFTAQVSDGELKTTAEVLIQIDPIPLFEDISQATRLGEPVTFPLTVKNIDQSDLLFSKKTAPQHGSLVINSNQTATYTPEIDATGEDTFEIEASSNEVSLTSLVSIENNLALYGNIAVHGGDAATAEILLTGERMLERIQPNNDGSFKVYGLEDGRYAVKVRKKGYQSSPAQGVNLNIEEQGSIYSPSNALSFSLEVLDNSVFTYHWAEDQSTAGSDYSAYINQPIEVEFLGETVEVVDDAAAIRLQHEYNILLVDGEHSKWTQEHAYRILEIMKAIPQNKREYTKAQSLSPIKVQLTSSELPNDIKITRQVGDALDVLISEAAFVNASPRLAKVEGKRGVFFSNRLHHALVRLVTDNGSDKAAYEKILNERFGVTTDVSDYSILTKNTTNEPAGRFQEFHAEEILQIINMLEEMPKGMHKLQGLKHLVRRLNGTPHPLYSSAPAVAWPNQGYIEFMETAFNIQDVEHVHRLIIHEKAHFLWANQFEQQLKNDWIDLGGWYQDGASPSGWYTTKQTEFVSAYAHLKNPNEDMAESMAYFIVNPDKLRSRALGKYEFIRDRIMQGNIYISQIREDLTFKVYNLYPDYVFPGKIKRLDISVQGTPEEDKQVVIEAELHALDAEVEGAKHAYLRIYSELGTFVDLYLYAVDEYGNKIRGNNANSTLLKGSFKLSKYAKSGFWYTDQIRITDTVGNERMESANDFGWKLYVNNPLEDVLPPEYVANSAQLTKSITEVEGNEVQVIHASWQVDENQGMHNNQACYASFNNAVPDNYRHEEYGEFNKVENICEVNLLMPHYMPSSVYSLNYITMRDQALNRRGTYFTHPGSGLRQEQTVIDELPQAIELVTNNPDTAAPELDVNNIFIESVPVNQEIPNGETKVTVTFNVRDDISGYRIASLYLRDPQGITHYFSAPNDETWSVFPASDPTEWDTYTRTIILPKGSAPGTWGLSAMNIKDRAGNFKNYDFTELIHFDVID